MKSGIKKIVDKYYKGVSKEKYYERFFERYVNSNDSESSSEVEIQNMDDSGKEEILDFWKSETELYYNLEFETVLRAFGGYYDPSEISKREIVDKITEGLEAALEKGRQAYNYNIQLFNIDKISQKIKVGDFEIINKNEYLNLFDSKEAKIYRERITLDNTVFWSCNLTVSEKYRGLEVIEEYIELFTNCIRVLYMAIDFKESVNFFNGNVQSYRDVIIINQSGIPTGPSKIDKRFKIINLEDKIFNEFDPIWNKLFRIKIENNEIFKRIKIALMWLGESMEENRVEQAFVKAIFSLEALIGKKDRGSLAENLSRNVAIILCDSYENRIKMKDKIRRLYTIRSKAVHGESMVCSQQDYLEVCQIVRNIILKFINDSEFNKFDKFKQIEDKINKVLYS